MVDAERGPQEEGAASSGGRLAHRGRRRREAEWQVVTRIQPQGEEGLRWLQLGWAPESISSWWPPRRGEAER